MSPTTVWPILSRNTTLIETDDSWNLDSPTDLLREFQLCVLSGRLFVLSILVLLGLSRVKLFVYLNVSGRLTSSLCDDNG